MIKKIYSAFKEIISKRKNLLKKKMNEFVIVLKLKKLFQNWKELDNILSQNLQYKITLQFNLNKVSLIIINNYNIKSNKSIFDFLMTIAM